MLKVCIFTSDCVGDEAYVHHVDAQYINEVMACINVLYGKDDVVSVVIEMIPDEPDTG